MVEFCNAVHWDPKDLLKIDALWEKFEVISPLTSKGGMAGIFFVTWKTIYYFPISFSSCNGIIQFFTHLGNICCSWNNLHTFIYFDNYPSKVRRSDVDQKNIYEIQRCNKENNIFVTNNERHKMKEEEMRGIMGKCGNVKSLKLRFHPNNTSNEAMICFSTEEEAQIAITEINTSKNGDQNCTNQSGNQ